MWFLFVSLFACLIYISQDDLLVVHSCETIHRNMGKLPFTISSAQNMFPLLAVTHCQYLSSMTQSHWDHQLHLCLYLACFILSRSSMGNHSCCETMTYNITVMFRRVFHSTLPNSLLLQSSWFLFYWDSLNFCWCGEVEVAILEMSHFWLSTNSHMV